MNAHRPARHRSTAKPTGSSSPVRLRPLVAALAAALPWLLVAGSSRAAPAAATVPVPAAGWRVFGHGPTTAPVNTTNAKGGTNQLITQSSQRAIYNWQSFDIGAASQVTFDMALPGSSALNRVTGSATPSQVFGSLKATNGGELVLINANGILFGKGAQVSTGSLIASTLNLSDAEFQSGLTHHLLYDPANPAFKYEGAPEDFIDAKNFVRVENGASIQTTGNGGRVFLFAKKVENAGLIETSGGQTVLAGGSDIYLKNPSGSKLYASQDNPEVPALRGLLIEVGGRADLPEAGAGSASNLAGGEISSPRGNTTLVGMMVNQSGVVRATSSVTENGTIFLRAQGGAFQGAAGGGKEVRSSESGVLTLGPGSLTTITPDLNDLGSDGKLRTTDGNATFVQPRIDLVGHSVELQTGAQVVTPGAMVQLRAENVPNYDARSEANYLGGDDSARVVLGENAVIDVSGTTDASVSVSRYFVTTELLGSNDLKDAPLQKDGLLYRSKATIDVRQDSLILGNLDSYRAGLQKSIVERLATGGQVTLAAEGAVLTHASSSIHLQGGAVKVLGDAVRETRLMASDGTLYDLNHAPIDGVYTQAENLQQSAGAGYTRWGAKVNYGQLTPVRDEAGYIEGRAAGTLNVIAPTVVLAGSLKAGVTAGTRQLAGLDARATGASLNVGAVRQGGEDFNSSGYGGDAVLKDFRVADAAPAFDTDFWANALQSSLPVTSGMARSLITQSGLSQVSVAAEGDVTLAAPATAGDSLKLPDLGGLRLLSTQGSVNLNGGVQAHSGSVELVSKTGAVSLAADQQVDLSGRWINVLQDGLSDTSTKVGGKFTASGGQGVSLGANSLVDVSGGAVVAASGSVSGGKAGSISIKSTASTLGPNNGLVLGGRLLGESLSDGGSLSLSAPQVQIGTAETAPAEGTLLLSPDLFTQGGFSSYSVDGRLALDVTAGTLIKPNRDNWVIDPRVAALVATGTALDWAGAAANPAGGLRLSAGGLLASAGLAPGAFAPKVNLTLASSGAAGQGGGLTVGQGAQINLVNESTLNLSARNHVLMDGQLRSAAGTVNLSIDNQADASLGEATWLWLGSHSAIDVSGFVKAARGTDGLWRGSVLDGGTVNLSANGNGGIAGSLLFGQEAAIISKGAQGTLSTTLLTAAGPRTEQRDLVSAGGKVNIVSNGNLVLDGWMDLHGGQLGSSSGRGGSLSVALEAGNDVARTGNAGSTLPRELRLTAYRTRMTDGKPVGSAEVLADAVGRASVSAGLIDQSGAADVRLAARETLRFQDDISLNLAGSLSLQSQSLAAAAGTHSTLQAGQISLVAPAARTDDPQMVQPRVTAGDAELSLQSRGGLLVQGAWVSSGVGKTTLQAEGDLMLQGRAQATSSSANTLQGSLSTLGDLNLNARQIYPATDTAFTISAAGHAVTIGAGDATAESPLSAGGQLSISAGTLTQGGVIRAPQGQISLVADTELKLTDGSVTSVSAAGLVLPYGTVSGSRWVAPDGSLLEELPTKRVDLKADSVQVASGAQVSLKAGGDLVGYEFVAGKGGSRDVFAGGDGSYALVPGIQTAASYDTSLNGAAALGRQIEIGTGGPVPAGVYTLLPARYALQPGVFLVTPVGKSSSTPISVLGATTKQSDGSYAVPVMDLGAAVKDSNGSTFVGARLRDEGGGLVDALPSTWRLAPQEVARQSSEIRSTSANTEFTRRAVQAGVDVAERPVDAGTLSVSALRASLDGSVKFDAQLDDQGQALGQGGRAEFVASTIRVDGANPVADAGDGVLHLGAQQLNQLGAQTVVLGATSAAAGSGLLKVSAQEVDFAQGSQSLNLPDLLVLATERITVEAGSQFQAKSASTSSGALRNYRVVGDGAALRLANAPGAGFTRTGSSGARGALSVGAGVGLKASGGSLLLDASQSNQLDTSAQLSAADITLAAPGIALAAAADPTQLTLSETLLAQLSKSDSLTLRAYQGITLGEGARLGEASLAHLVLDTPALNAGQASGPLGAQVVAGDLTLTNTTGLVASPTDAGTGQLSLMASSSAGGSGQIHLGRGSQAVQGTGTLTLSADQALLLGGSQQFSTDADLHLITPLIGASVAGVQSSLTVGGALTLGPASGAGASSTSTSSSLGGATGAVLQISAREVDDQARIVLPAGVVQIQTETGLRLGSGAVIDVAGTSPVLDGTAVPLDGGRVQLASSTGSVRLASGSRIDVSAAAGGSTGAQGGSLSLRASQGSLSLEGTLSGQGGASFSADSAGALPLDALAAQFAASTGHAADFSGDISLRQRQGDLSLSAGKTLTAQRLELSADAGSLTVAGTLDSRGAEGGRIALASGSDLLLADSAQLLASASSSGGAGGQISLATTSGSLQLGSGAGDGVLSGPLLDVRAGSASAQSGRLTLRAPRVGFAGPDAGDAGAGNEVAIAPLAARIQGAGRIDVEALAVYDASSLPDLPDGLSSTSSGLLASVNSQAQAFVGAAGENAEAMAQRLSGGRQSVLDALRIHAGAELRSTGDLTIKTDTDWVLPSESASLPAGSHVGDTSLTLRAAGNLNLQTSLVSGGVPTTGSTDAPSAQGGSLRLVAGADLSGAALSAVRDDGQGTLSLGQSTTSTTVATSTGEILLAAAGDVRLVDGHVRVFNTGLPDTSAATQAVHAAGLSVAGAMADGAGDVSLLAGGSVVGRTVLNDPLLGVKAPGHPTEWSTSGQTDTLNWWAADVNTFQHGLGSFGGGQMRVQAGRDVANLVVASPGSGNWENGGAVVRHGGGSVWVTAGRDVVNGVVQAGGPTLSVRAGRDIAFRDTPALEAYDEHGLVLVHADSQVHLAARRNLSVGSLQSVYGLGGRWLSGLDTKATLSAVATAGNLVWRNDDEPNLGLVDGVTFNTALMLLPSQVSIAAPEGSVTFAGSLGGNNLLIQQAQQRDAKLDILAGRDLTLGYQLQVNAASLSTQPAFYGVDNNLGLSALDNLFPASGLRRSDAGALDGSSRAAVHLVAEQGDVNLRAGLRVDRPLTLSAGRDILFGADAAVEIAHQPLSTDPETGAQRPIEISSLQAGRDITLGSASLLVGGPGELVLLAGRNIDLGSGAGLISNGNNDNTTLLPASSAAVSLVAGLRADGADYGQAVRQGFAVLGAGLAEHPGEIYAWLSSGAAGGTAPTLGGAAATAFDALPLAQRLDQVHSLLGDAAWNTALATYVRSLPGHTTQTTTQALAAFDGLSESLRSAAVGSLLATRLGEQPAAQRQALIGALAQAESSNNPNSTGTALVAWMASHEGRSLSLAGAIAAFEALPLERQVSWLDSLLVAEVRRHGRAAVGASSVSAQSEAYAQAYAAINLIFPIDRPEGSITMPQSTVRTLQGGDISLMALGGGVNAGETGSSIKSANELGVVTVGGGAISALVRNDFLVNQSRVFTLAQGDVLLWSSEGDIDAGRGAKTVVGSPPPVYKLDANGRIVVDTSGSFSGSGIAVLDARSSLDLYAPSGAIDAGEAGIRSSGNVVLGAVTVRGADDIKGGSVQGAPAAPPAVPLGATLSPVAETGASAGNDDEAQRRRRRARRALLLEFLGFGKG